MIGPLVQAVLRLILPKAPQWVGVIVPPVVELVLSLAESIDLSDPLEDVLHQALVQTDAALDELPGWRDLSEERRDTILKGVVELVLFVRQMIDTYGKRVTKKALKRAVGSV